MEIKHIAVIALLLISNLNIFYAQIEPGTLAPDFSLTPLTGGGSLSLYDILLKRTVLYFWTPASSEMKLDMIKLQDLYSKYDGLQVIAILAFPEDESDAIRFINANKIKFPNLIGNRETALKYKVVDAAPAVIVIDENKKILTAQKSGLTDELINLIIQGFAPISSKRNPKLPVPEPKGPQSSSSLIGWRICKWTSLLGIIGSGVGTWHYKKRADFYYNKYLAATDTGEVRRLKQLVKKNDLYWQLSLGGGVGLTALFIYTWIKEEGIKSELGSTDDAGMKIGWNFGNKNRKFSISYGLEADEWRVKLEQKL
jgi:peroxiredoxin